jgi:hypothetical protein
VSKIVQHPEKLDSRVDFLNVGVWKPKPQEETLQKRKKHWEREEKPFGISIPVVSSLPSSASNGDVVWCDGLYIYNDGWQRINNPTPRRSEGASGGGSVVGVFLFPEPEAVYSSRTGGGTVYVVVTNSGLIRRLLFDATTLPSNDASATFGMTAGGDDKKIYNLLFSVISNQHNKELHFRIITDNTYDFVVATDGAGVGYGTIQIKSSSTITVTRRYSSESGLVYPCWTACALMLF